MHGSSYSSLKISKPYTVACRLFTRYHEQKALLSNFPIFLNSLHSLASIKESYQLNSDFPPVVLKLGFNITRFSSFDSKQVSMDFVRQKYPHIGDPSHLLSFVGGISLQKDQFGLIKTFERVLISQPDCCLFLVGKPGNDFSRCQQLISDLNLTNRVVLTETVSDHTLGHILNASSLYLSSLRVLKKPS